MTSHLLEIATAIPDHVMSQEAAAETMIELFGFRGSMASKLKDLYKNSAIEKRHSASGEFHLPIDDRKIWGRHFLKNPPKLSEINTIYKEEAPKLALKAARKVLEKWNSSSSAITHVISVSCTGLMAPGIEAMLVRDLSLDSSVERYGVNFMGCFGAFKGLGLADALAKEHPKNRVLVVCTELCSLHLQAKVSMEAMVSNALFADGCAAAIVGQRDPQDAKPHYEIVKRASEKIPNTFDKMSWEIGDNGFIMGLSKDVPSIFEEVIPDFVKKLIPLKEERHDWAIHPGGRLIIEKMEKALSLSPEETRASWDVLKNYGNMSSATFLFILEQVIQREKKNPYCVGMAMGPGLTIEGILFKHVV